MHTMQGSDLSRYNEAGTVFAGFHYGASSPSGLRTPPRGLSHECADLNMLTIHGKSRFLGLFIWLRDGRRVPVHVPDGCLLLQARVDVFAPRFA